MKETALAGDLADVVSHLSKKHDDSVWKIDEITRHLCYAALHPELQVKHYEQYVRRFEAVAPAAGRAAVYDFWLLRRNNDPASIFAAFFGLRLELIEQIFRRTLSDLLCVSDAQQDRLGAPPIKWAEARTESLQRALTFRTKEWVRTAVDVQSPTPDLDEAMEWREWRAPLLLAMQPSGAVPVQPDRFWERQDEEKSLRWLERFAAVASSGVTQVISHIIGEARLNEAKSLRAGVSSAVPAQAPSERPESASDTFSYAEDYRSIRWGGRDYTLTLRQATMVSLLHRAFVAGYADVPKDRLLSAVEAETSEVRDAFRKSPLWNTLIIRGAKRGTYKLSIKKLDSGRL